MNSLKNNHRSTDFSLWVWHRLKSVLLLLLCLLFPLISGAQTLRTKGNIKIRANNCPKIYVNGSAKFDSLTVLEGSADFQATGGSAGRKFEGACKLETFEGCQIKTYTGAWVHILMSNAEKGKVDVELFDLHGKGIYTIFSQEKTTPTWGTWLEIKDLPDGAYFVQVKLNGKKYCSQKIGNFEKKLPCMSLFPNPTAEDFLNIHNLGKEIGEREPLVYQIWDMQGRQMFSPPAKNTLNQIWQISVSHLTAGIYVLQVGDCILKFVKQ